MYDKLPGSLKTECLVRTKVETDEATLKQRQEMTRSMTPGQLGEIRGLSDFPVPTLRKKKREEEESRSRSRSKENLYERLPGSLKTECLVRTKVVTDEKVLKERQELTKAKTPGELGDIKGFSDLTMLTARKKKEKPRDQSLDRMSVKSKENLYERLPGSLKAECLVRTKVEEDEVVLKERQELTRSKTPAQLSQIHGLGDIPFPTLRKAKSHDKLKMEEDTSKSKENLYERLPGTLKTECLVRTREEDPEVLKERQILVKNKTPAELGEIHGLSDFPLPKFAKKKAADESDATSLFKAKSKENIYERLPESLKTECLVRAKPINDEKLLKERQEMTRTMTPAQLGEIRGLSDFPIPTLRKKKEEKREKSEDRVSTKSKENLYERLPESLKTECLVRAKVEEDEKVLKERQELTKNLTPAQLSEIHGLSDFPLPKFGRKKKPEPEPVRYVILY